MIAGRRLLAADDDVAPGGGVGGDGAGLAGRARAGFDPGERTGRSPSPRPCRGGSRRARRARCARRVRSAASAARRPDRAARHRDRAASAHATRGRRPARDLGAAFEARKGQAPGLERGKRRAVVVEMLGLPPDRLFPCEPEPGEILVDRRLEFRPAARRVDILDAQQQAPAGRPRHVEVEERRQRMAEMQIAVRARREAENGLRHDSLGCHRPRKRIIQSC